MIMTNEDLGVEWLTALCNLIVWLKGEFLTTGHIAFSYHC